MAHCHLGIHNVIYNSERYHMPHCTIITRSAYYSSCISQIYLVLYCTINNITDVRGDDMTNI